MSRWHLFGRPLPTTGRAADGTPVMRNNGEGSFESGVLSRETFDASNGLAIDLRVSTRVTATQWQALRLDVFAAMDTAPYVRARNRNISPIDGEHALRCDVAYPVEGMRVGDTPIITLASDAEAVRVTIPDATLLQGTWHTIRLQFLPDHRCALALDGVPLAITAHGRAPSSQARIGISGNMAETEMLAGRLRVYEGVPADIDWSKAKVVQR